MEEVDIRVSQTLVGKVQLDPAEIRGEGGEYDPRLVILIRVELQQQSPEHQIIITRLSASLHLDQNAFPNNQFASKTVYEPTYDMQMRSLYGSANVMRPEFRFSLTHAQLKVLENMRHESGKSLYLKLEPVITWNKHTVNNDSLSDPSRRTLGEHGWDTNFGLISELWFFWQSTIWPLRLDFTKMQWTTAIFPGMGYDNFRLIEVKLPASNTLVPVDAIDHFKDAQRDYDNTAHIECVMKLRLAHEAIEKHLKVQAHELGKAVTKALGWTPGSEQEQYLDGAWKALYVIACASHHTPSVKSLLPADAHAVLISTAVLLEYLAQLE
jgi:hypothetical protein